MSNALLFGVDTIALLKDPLSAFGRHAGKLPNIVRASCPIYCVPEIDEMLMTNRDNIFTLNKEVDILCSNQSDGIITNLIGHNMMRHYGADPHRERKIISLTLSNKTVQTDWAKQFKAATQKILTGLARKSTADLLKDFAILISGEALNAITDLTQMIRQNMDRLSQEVIDCRANYTGDPELAAPFNYCTASSDAHNSDGIAGWLKGDNISIIVQQRAGLSNAQQHADAKLTIAGVQNDLRDAVAGTLWAILERNTVLEAIHPATLSYLQGFQEFTPWISPIGMSPRQIAKPYHYNGVDFVKDTRAFLVFSFAKRGETYFVGQNQFDPWRDKSKSIHFGTDLHFCAGAWASGALIVKVALPMIIDAFPSMRLNRFVEFNGWAFRGPLKVHVTW